MYSKINYIIFKHYDDPKTRSRYYRVYDDKFDYLIKIDTDALITGNDIIKQIEEYFRNNYINLYIFYLDTIVIQLVLLCE